MPKNHKEIKSWTYDPTNGTHLASQRGAFGVIMCPSPEKCEAYSKQRCICMNSDTITCPSGGYEKRTASPTTRSKGYRGFFTRKEEKHRASLKAELHPLDTVSYIGGAFVYLPIPYIEWITENPETKHIVPVGDAGPLSYPIIIRKEDFTPDNILAMFRMEPKAYTDGGTITCYREKYVPMFARQLKDCDPGLYGQVEALMTEEERTRLTASLNIGRTALLHTLNPDTGTFKDIYGGEWTWDGEWLASTDSHAEFLLTQRFSEIRIRPDRGTEVAVTDEAQVNADTEFTDCDA